VGEAQGLGLDAVHEDDPHPGEGVVAQLVVRRLHEVAPREPLLLQRHAGVPEEVDGHGSLLAV
jgi:hypothetical protein